MRPPSSELAGPAPAGPAVPPSLARGETGVQRGRAALRA